MRISENGLSLIKRYEGCRLTAYKCVSTEQYYTIGYGHYGADVYAGMTITQAQADAYLKSDVAKFENYVNNTGLLLNQNQFDALVSFTYNCGPGNLKKLIANGTLEQIAQAIPLYNKSGGKVLAGLVKRRAEEQALFLKSGNANAVTMNTNATNTSSEDADVKRVYVVQGGDNLSKIAAKFNTTVSIIAKVNDIKNVNLIRAGQKLVIVSGYEVRVTSEGLNVRYGPSVAYGVKSTLSKGDASIIMEERNGWGKTVDNGWLNLKYTERIE